MDIHVSLFLLFQDLVDSFENFDLVLFGLDGRIVVDGL